MNRVFRVVYISPTTTRNEGGARVAADLENLIQQNVDQGWQYEGVETISTWVQGSKGCFGFGATPGYSNSLQMVVFSRNNA
ncbi:MAG: hypothetical protein AAFR61_20295 [Bacteroidota bacterium]